MGLTARVASIIGFLRAGYPTGAPAKGYVPLLALLPRRISEDETTRITGKLIGLRRGPIDNVEIHNVDVGVEITHVTGELPSSDDIKRVQHCVAAIRKSASHG
jgi:hypothetical protein